MKNENLLQTLSFLALRMENSGTELIEAIAPGKLVRMDAARTNEPHRLVIRRKTSLADENPLAAENQSESKETDIQEVIRGVEQLANYLEDQHFHHFARHLRTSVQPLSRCEGIEG